jgi:4-aminobutyrate aminotransferase-like enzyme/Ser/Thr protein kinase RdoA (MazF antagonist)
MTTGDESPDGAADVLDAEPPKFTTSDAEEIAARHFDFRASASALASERDQNFLLEDETGARGALKISSSAETTPVIEMEIAAAVHAKRVDPELPISQPWAVTGRPEDGSFRAEDHHAGVNGNGGANHRVRMYDFMEGEASASPLSLDHDQLWEFGRIVARLGRALRGFFHPAGGRVLLWDVQHARRLRPLAEQIADPARQALVGRILDRFEQSVLPRWPLLRSQVIHGDLTLDNATLDDRRQVTGILDFGDMSHTALVCDIPAAWASVLSEHRGDDLFRSAAAFLDGYRTVTPLEEIEISLLADLFAARSAAAVAISAVRVARYPDNEYIADFDTEAWPLLELYDELGPEEAARRFGARSFSRTVAIDGLLERRRQRLGSALMAPSYERPLHLVKGDGVWMSDAEGRRYLDCYNNVPVVGHSHPRVVEASNRQAMALNTNMRYLHEAVIELGERLVASMPEGSGLDTVMMVNSGSEANDLAWRLARSATGNSGGLSSDYAYHGITSAIADLSPEASSSAKPDCVETFPPPSGADGVALAGFSAAVERLSSRGLQPAAVLVDGAFTSDGIYPAGPSYLEEVVRLTHAAGGLYVADEVQAGHGRSGEHLWSFAAAGITPDIVTMGKPMGNGYPVAALVTRSEIADRFAGEGEFFSTFGGNPPGAVAALTVLDVIADAQLIERVARVGSELRAGIERLADRHATAGEVRGQGLMIGVEMIRAGSSSRLPDPALADLVKNGLRERGVLIGTTGPDDNVLKIRPPLVFGSEHAGIFLEALAEVLASER